MINFNEHTKPMLMGILNVTPDSFSDGGKYNHIEAAIQQAALMLTEGADIIDIGGESTRPGSESVAAEEQIQRVIPVINTLQEKFSKKLLISIDTSLATVAEAALNAGARLINDVTAGQKEPEILTLAAKRNAPIILMHSLGTPRTMQDNPTYKDVIAEVIDFITARITVALGAGINKSNIIIDPGIGFGKRKQDNLDLLANLDKFVALGYPVLLGTSRKRFMGSLLDISEPAKLVTATAVTTALGVMSGIKLFRVHDVKENKQALEVAWAIKQSR